MKLKSRPIFAGFILFVCLSSWSFSAPINSGYDATFHLSNIWCAWGEKSQICENYGPRDDGYKAEVPSELGVFRNSQQLNEVSVATPSTQSLFYKVFRVFVTPNTTLSVLLMRLFNSLIAASIFSALLFFSAGRVRSAIVSAWTVTVCPIIISTIPQPTPRSWSYLAGISSWAFLYLAMTSLPRSRRSFLLWSLYVFTMFLAFTSRWDGTLMVVFSSLLLIAIHSVKKNLISYRSLIGYASLSLLVFGIARALIPRLAAYSTFNFGSTFTSGHTIFQVVHIVENIADGLGLGIKYHDLGPNLIGIIGVSVFIATITSAMIRPNRWQLASLFATSVFVFLSMFRISLNWIEATGPYGIYTVQLLTVLVGLILLYSNSEKLLFENLPSRYALVSLISLGHLLALFSRFEWAVRPNDILNDTYVNLSLNGGWWWNSPIGPNIVFLIGAIAFPAWLLISWSVVTKPPTKINS
jgi:hypothetical protein